MVGLAESIPDEGSRLNHILTDMVFAIAVTEITALMSRRTLYCAKDASSEFSAARFASSSGNIWHERVEHSFDGKGRCSECGGTKEQLEINGRDNYAYGFIHADGRSKIDKEMDMKFDVIVGNPPYQMESDGSNRTLPLYNLFVDQAIALNPRYIAMITPSRWTASGLGLSEYRDRMLKDRRIRVLVDYPNASEVFPGVEIKGGVSYFLWDAEWFGDCDVTLIRGEESHGPSKRNLAEYDVLVRDSRALDILHRIEAAGEPSFMEIFAVDKEFGMTSNFSNYRDVKQEGDIALHANRGGKRLVGWVSDESITKSRHLIPKWKVMVPQAGSDGGQRLPDVVLGTPFIVEPPSVCTQTYLFAYVDSRQAAESVESYVRTKLFRFLVSLRKISQHATRSTYLWVPQQAWSRTWSDSVLYEKYGITLAQQEYIDHMIKDMPA
jgi:site-specific DNA-methyltransferase (adenine-specific)